MNYAFLVHARDYSDVRRKYKIAKYLPRSFVEFWCLHWPPIVVSEITGLKCQKTSKELKGWVVGIPMTAKQMMENRELAKKRVLQAARKAEKLGAEIAGLGALTSSVTFGGREIRDKLKIKITAGHAYTAFTVGSYVLQAIKKKGIENKDAVVAIVGAAGSIGSTCAKYLCFKGVKKFLLVDLERKSDRLQVLMKKLCDKEKLEILLSHKIGDIKIADIIISATNTPEALIKPEDLKTGAIIVDDAQPSDISPEVEKQRKDVLVVDGGVLLAPGINPHINLGLAHKNNIFSCLGEVMICASTKRVPEYTPGDVSPSVVEEVGSLGSSLGFEVNEFQRGGNFHKK